MGRLFALLVGIDEYETLGHLRFAVADVLAICKVLCSRFAFTKAEITLLTSPVLEKAEVDKLIAQDGTCSLEGAHAISIHDGLPDRVNVLGLLRQFAQVEMRPEDTFLLFFASHGFSVNNVSCLMPWEAPVDDLQGSGPIELLEEVMISLPTLARYWQHIAAGQQIMIMDACRENPLPGVRGMAATGGLRRTFDGNLARDARMLVSPTSPLSLSKNRAVLSGCGPGQVCHEYPEKRHGWFTHNLIACLEESSELTLSVDELGRRVMERMERLAKTELHSAIGQQCCWYLEGQANDLHLRPVERSSKGLRRVDAAIKGKASVGENLDVLVQVRFVDSPYLGTEDLDWPSGKIPEPVQQVSEALGIKFVTNPLTGEAVPVRLKVRLLAPDFKIHGKASKAVDVSPESFSPVIRFVATPKRRGVCRIDVEVYGGESYLGAIPIETNVDEGFGTYPSIACLKIHVLVVPGERIESAGLDLQNTSAPLAEEPRVENVVDKTPDPEQMIVAEPGVRWLSRLVSGLPASRAFWIAAVGFVASIIIALIFLAIEQGSGGTGAAYPNATLTPLAGASNGPGEIVASAGSSNAAGQSSPSSKTAQGSSPISSDSPNARPIGVTGASNGPREVEGGAGTTGTGGQSSPSIRITIDITVVPPKGMGPDSLARIAGDVAGVQFSACKIIVFAYADKWYVQPTENSPYTSIDSDGKWENNTHLGSEYAVLLVKSNYKPPHKSDILPQVAGGVLAVRRVSAAN